MHRIFVSLSLLTLSACGFEGLFANAGRDPQPQPISRISGGAALAACGAGDDALEVLDDEEKALEPVASTIDGGRFVIDLPAAKYVMARVQCRAGNLAHRTIVPLLPAESSVSGVTLDPRNTAETLIAETRLAYDDTALRWVNPDAYAGTRALIRAAFDVDGPARDLLDMVERLVRPVCSGGSCPGGGAFDVELGETNLFRVPKIDVCRGLTRCGDDCVDTEIDLANCGACGKRCAEGLVCLKGRCAVSCAMSGWSICCDKDVQDCANSVGVQRTCADLQRDRRHCGACNSPCAAGQICESGKCKDNPAPRS